MPFLNDVTPDIAAIAITTISNGIIFTPNVADVFNVAFHVTAFGLEPTYESTEPIIMKIPVGTPNNATINMRPIATAIHCGLPPFSRFFLFSFALSLQLPLK